MSAIRKAGGLAAAAAAGAVWLYARSGAKTRERVRGWALKLKGEALEEIGRARNVNRETYDRVVEQVARRYRHLKKVNQRELRELVKELKGSWNRLDGRS